MKLLKAILILTLLSSCAAIEVDELVGEWKVYPKQFIKSERAFRDKSYTVNMPIEMVSEAGKMVKWGSLERSIENLEKGKSYSLLVSGIYCSGKIWIDGELKKSYGKIGKSIESSIPYVTPDIINFTAIEERANLVIEFSNFHLKDKNVFKNLEVGNKKSIQELYIRRHAEDYFSSGILIMISLFFLLIFVSNIKGRHNLYFSLFTLFYGIRSFLMGKTSIQFIIPDFPWTIMYQIIKASELWALFAIILFFMELYPMELKRKFTKVLLGVSISISFLIFIPIEIFSYLKLSYLSHLVVLVTGIYFLINLILAVKRKRALARLSLFSVLLFFISTINDILSNRYLVPWGYLSDHVIVFLVITMCILTSKERRMTEEGVIEEEIENQRLKKTFSRFVPVDILKIIGNVDLKDRPPGESTLKAYTVVFIDIRDYTKLSQGLSPKENFEMINSFFEIVGRCVSSNRGYIESYGGDGVKVLFPDSPGDAIDMALELSREVAKSLGIKIGISINFGQLVLGTIGTKRRIQATAISQAVKELYAMDNFNSVMGIEILITENVLKLSNIHYNRVMGLGPIRLKGEEEAREYFQLIPEDYKIDSYFKDAFENGVFHLKAGDLVKAKGYFELANIYQPSHTLTKFYLKEIGISIKNKEISFSLSL